MHRFLYRAAIALGTLLFSPLGGANEEIDFETSARHSLAEVHADSFRTGDFETCVSIYQKDAKFYVDNQLLATGKAELLAFYQKLKAADGIQRIEVEKFVEVQSEGNSGWVVFTYKKVYDLTVQDPHFIKEHQLEGFTTLHLKQYGTAMFRKTNGHWKILTMAVFDPEIWEPKK